MIKLLIIVALALSLTACGESEAVKELKRCSEEVMKMPFDPEKQLEAQGFCDWMYDSSFSSNE
jgi:hypothetical protein